MEKAAVIQSFENMILRLQAKRPSDSMENFIIKTFSWQFQKGFSIKLSKIVLCARTRRCVKSRIMWTNLRPGSMNFQLNLDLYWSFPKAPRKFVAFKGD